MCEQASADAALDADVIPLNERRRLIHGTRWGDFGFVFFSRPVLVWVPEARRRSRRPFCVVPGCKCEPSVKERKQRVIEDVGYKYNVLYVKYQCTSKVASGKARTLSTLSASFLEANPDVAVHLPFVISKKMGFSKGLMEHVHEGILSPNGLSRALNHLERRRRNRYYELLSKFVYAVNQKYRENAAYLPPIPPTVDAYLTKNKVVSQNSLTDAWLAYTELYGSLCEVVIMQTKVKKVMRADHSVKFCKRLKLWSGRGQRDNLADAKMLLLLQNEIGQIVGRRLTSSENKDETMQLLSDVRSQLEADGDCYFISDNASAVQKFVAEALDDSVVVKQDPFYVIQRFREKLKSKSKRKLICQELSSAMYDVDRELRPPVEMEANLRAVLGKIADSELGCTPEKWRNCIEHNIAQIKLGELHVAENVYNEGGGPPARVVSTSQLEGFHSALKKLLAREVRVELGLRILDVFIVQHNLDVGARFGRNPRMENIDLISACRAATVCKLYGERLVADTAEQEFVSNLVSASLPRPQYRSSTERDFAFSSWQQIFGCADLDASGLETNLSQSRQHLHTIKELLFKNATTLQCGEVDRAEFMHSLRIEEDNPEGAAGFSPEEHELLRQVLREQKECGRTWADCVLVTTIMFNLVVASNRNARIRLCRRSYRTLEAKVKALRDDSKQASKQSTNTRKTLFHFRNEPECTGRATDHERALQQQLFDTLRHTNIVSQKRLAFCRLYDFASCVCGGVRAFDKVSLERRWGALKKSSSSFTIKFKNVRSALRLNEAYTSSARNDDNEAGASSAQNNASEGDAPTHNNTNEDDTSARNTANDGDLDRYPRCVLAESAPPVLADGESRLPSGDNGVFVSGQVVRSSPPVIISSEHMEILRLESEKFKATRGKAAHLMNVFKQYYPQAALTPNQLRMKIRNSTRRPSQVCANGPAQTTPSPDVSSVREMPHKTRKRKATSCLDCRQKHVKCGDSKNPQCLKLVSKSTNTLDSYFSTPS